MTLAILGMPLAVIAVWLRLAGVPFVPDVTFATVVLASRFDPHLRVVRVSILTGLVEGLTLGTSWLSLPMAGLVEAWFAYGIRSVIPGRGPVSTALMTIPATLLGEGALRVMGAPATPVWGTVLSTSVLTGLLSLLASRQGSFRESMSRA